MRKKNDACWEAAKNGRARLGCSAVQVDDPGCPRCRESAHHGIRLRKVGKGIPGGCPRGDYSKRRWVADADLAADHVVHVACCDSERLLVRQVGAGINYNAIAEAHV